MKKKKNIFLVGPMGAGKSTIGRFLAKQLNMKFYDSDIEIERKAGANIDWIFDVEGESKFRIREEKMINKLTNKFGVVLATGGGSILSLKSRNFLINRGFVIYLRTSIDEQLIRTNIDKNRPLLSNNINKNKKLLSQLFKIRDPLYRSISNFIVDTSNKKVKFILSKILSYISNLNFI
ncbi:shikimate kinase AroK [Buchnera aphidicola]|uniref:shikimate kinase AroK n=1 Tax=Buchnera aphidicola TaxID=9 RepID=UPI00059FD9F8|nr:shikimate kinase AroK [Buchnera aphidicola]